MAELTEALAHLPEPDDDARAAVRDRASRVLRPAGAFDRLDEVAVWLAGWQRSPRPAVRGPAAVLFAADHGVADEGVSAYSVKVTSAMVEVLEAGAGTASVLARLVDAELHVVDVGVGHPSGNLVRESALSEERFAWCLDQGRGAVRGLATDLLVLGEMGIGNTTAASAVCAALFGGTGAEWTGRGTGVDDGTLRRKRAVVEAARERLGPSPHPFEVLRQVGGPELAAICGAILEARLRSIPVVLDGFVVTASAAPLELVRPGALAHCIAGHRSPEPGHGRLLERLGLLPLLDLGLRLGEGTGALLAVPLIRAAAAAVTDVDTFEDWGLG
jgi:nicotinate-nucleotide--dimethylbenzimidazole phosphoribosyltransferase